jgi:hypothetical protein
VNIILSTTIAGIRLLALATLTLLPACAQPDSDDFFVAADHHLTLTAAANALCTQAHLPTTGVYVFPVPMDAKGFLEREFPGRNDAFYTSSSIKEVLCGATIHRNMVIYLRKTNLPQPHEDGSPEWHLKQEASELCFDDMAYAGAHYSSFSLTARHTTRHGLFYRATAQSTCYVGSSPSRTVVVSN